jgi:hypothetical protein
MWLLLARSGIGLAGGSYSGVWQRLVNSPARCRISKKESVWTVTNLSNGSAAPSCWLPAAHASPTADIYLDETREEEEKVISVFLLPAPSAGNLNNDTLSHPRARDHGVYPSRGPR